MVDEHISLSPIIMVSWKNHPSLKDTKIGDTPIFDFHEYWKRKSVDPTGNSVDDFLV